MVITTASLASLTGYSVRSIQRRAASIPGYELRRGLVVFRMGKRLSAWIERHTLPPSLRGRVGRKSQADVEQTPADELVGLLSLVESRLVRKTRLLTGAELVQLKAALAPISRIAASVERRIRELGAQKT